MAGGAGAPPALHLSGRVASSPAVRLPGSAVCVELDVAVPEARTDGKPVTLIELEATLVGTARVDSKRAWSVVRSAPAMLVSAAAPTPPGSATTVQTSAGGAAVPPIPLGPGEHRRFFVAAMLPRRGMPPSFRGTYAKFAYAIEATTSYDDHTGTRRTSHLVVPVRVSAATPTVAPRPADKPATPALLWAPAPIGQDGHASRAAVVKLEERVRVAAAADGAGDGAPPPPEGTGAPAALLPPRAYGVRVGDRPLLRVSLARPGGTAALAAAPPTATTAAAAARDARVPEGQVIAPGHTLAVLLDLACADHVTGDGASAALRCLQVEASLETEETVRDLGGGGGGASASPPTSHAPVRRVWDEWSEVTVDAQSSHLTFSVPADATPSFQTPCGVGLRWLIRFSFRAQAWAERFGPVEVVNWELPLVVAAV